MAVALFWDWLAHFTQDTRRVSATPTNPVEGFNDTISFRLLSTICQESYC